AVSCSAATRSSSGNPDTSTPIESATHGDDVSVSAHGSAAAKLPGTESMPMTIAIPPRRRRLRFISDPPCATKNLWPAHADSLSISSYLRSIRGRGTLTRTRCLLARKPMSTWGGDDAPCACGDPDADAKTDLRDR